MPGKMILKQIALALVILLGIVAINQINAPWSSQILTYIEYLLSEESSLEARDLQALGIVNNLNIEQDIFRWKGQLFNDMKEEVDSLSGKINEQVEKLVSRWKE